MTLRKVGFESATTHLPARRHNHHAKSVHHTTTATVRQQYTAMHVEAFGRVRCTVYCMFTAYTPRMTVYRHASRNTAVWPRALGAGAALLASGRDRSRMRRTGGAGGAEAARGQRAGADGVPRDAESLDRSSAAALHMCVRGFLLNIESESCPSIF